MTLSLAFGFSFADLYDTAALSRLDGAFLDELQKSGPARATQLPGARAELASAPPPQSFTQKDESELLIALGPHLESFLAKLFRIEDAARALAARGNALAPLYEVKRLFVQRVAAKKYKPEEAEGFDPVGLAAVMGLTIAGPDDELIFA